MEKIVIINPDDIAVIDESTISAYSQAAQETYLTMLTAMQPLVDEYERTGNISIEPPPTSSPITHEWMNDHLLRLNFRELFLSSANWIITKRNNAGKYVVLNDGHLRMYIAKKYGLRLPVYVDNE